MYNVIMNHNRHIFFVEKRYLLNNNLNTNNKSVLHRHNMLHIYKVYIIWYK